MRVISHTCSNTEIVSALGCEDFLIAVDDHSDYPPDVVSRLERIGPDLAIDIDRVVDLKPDLILTSLTLPGHENTVSLLQDTGIPILVCDPTTIDCVAEDIRRIADALGCSSQGAALAKAFLKDLEPVPVTETRPRILIEWWPKPVIVPGEKSWAMELIGRAGGQGMLAEPVKSRPVTGTEVVRFDPDAVIISWCGVPAAKYRPEVVYRREEWRSVAAIRNRQAHSVSEEFLGRPGPRLVEGYRRLKKIVAAIGINE